MREWAFSTNIYWLWKPMETYGNLWKSMETYGNLWKSMETYGNLWKSMEIYGNLWKSMEIWCHFQLGNLWDMPMFLRSVACAFGSRRRTRDSACDPRHAIIFSGGEGWRRDVGVFTGDKHMKKTGWWFQTWLDYFPFHIWDVIPTPLTNSNIVSRWLLHHQPKNILGKLVKDLFLWMNYGLYMFVVDISN